MASDINIHRNVITDCISRITTEGVTAKKYRTGAYNGDPTYPCVSVGVLNENAELGDVGGISGFHRLDIELDAQTYAPDDADTTDCQELLGVIRGAFSYDDILSKMNTLSTYNTYMYVAPTASDRRTEGRVNHCTITIQILMRPSNESD